MRPVRTNEDGPTVILMVGVNGSGKTTTAAKLTRAFQEEGKSVVLAAADTFRAGAVDQLARWGRAPWGAMHQGQGKRRSQRRAGRCLPLCLRT